MWIVIVEDDILLWEGLVLLLCSEGFDVIGVVFDVEGFFVFFDEVDVVVVDVWMLLIFISEGFKVVVEVCVWCFGFLVFVFLVYVEDCYVGEFFVVGVEGFGYLLKECVGKVVVFVDVLCCVVVGGMVMDFEVIL